jgi:adenylate cyclase
MAREIERKFLVAGDGWRMHADHGVRFVQGYLCDPKTASVRVRIEGEVARLNIKSAMLGISRHEYEYPIPLHDAEEMLQELCDGPCIAKTRYHVEHAGRVWEVDVFDGDNAGLIVAEIELDREDEPFERPGWLGAEVSHDARYYNVMLAKNPYKNWKHED